MKMLANAVNPANNSQLPTPIQYITNSVTTTFKCDNFTN